MRTKKKLLFSILLGLALLLGLMAVTATAEESGSTVLTEQMNDLHSGSYVVKDHVSFDGAAGESGLRIADGAVVTIYIEEGVVLTAKGGEASGKTGAGAGIEVPENASLTLLGKGYVIAKGGKAADGGAGSNGLNGDVRPNQDRGGNGGSGGAGGGGGGAGIGSKGGSGGDSGNGGNGDYLPNAKAGKPGNPGSHSQPCGTITIAVAIENNAQVTGGSAGSQGADGEQGHEQNKNSMTAWGGGSGGGGGGGGAGADYGRGGNGGGGGGGGNGGGYSANGSNGTNGAAGSNGSDGDVVTYCYALLPPVITRVDGAALIFGYTEGSVSVTAEPELGHEITYQWYINTTESNEGGTPIDTKVEPSAATAEYIIPAGKAADTVEYYYCVVTAKLCENNPFPANEVGSKKVVSDVVTVTVNKAGNVPASVDTIIHPYSGETQQLVKGGEVEGGTLLYALGKDAKNPPADGWSESVPTAKYPGTYYVWYKIVGDANHYDVEPACIVVTIRDNAACDFTLLASLKTTGKRGLILRWTEVPGAQGYDIFFGSCGSERCDYLTSVNGLSYKFRKLKKGNAYTAVVRAWWNDGGNKVYLGNPSPGVHAIAGGKNNKYTDPKSISVKKKKLTINVGGSKKIKASVKKRSDSRHYLNHTSKIRYFSNDRNVATVDEKGRVTGVNPGTCKVFAIAENGLRVGVKITVK